MTAWPDYMRWKAKNHEARTPEGMAREAVRPDGPAPGRSASGVASALFQAVNRAWGVQSPRLVLSGRLYSLAMIFVVGAFLLLALSIGPIVSLARAWQVPVVGWQPSAQPDTDRLVSGLSALAPALFSVCAFILIYRTMPRAGLDGATYGWEA